MRQRIYLAVAIFLQLTAIFLIAKGVFVAFNPATYTGLDTGGFLSVLLHGLPMDICVSGYLTVLPALTIVASVFIATERGLKIVRRVLYGEMAAAAIVAAVAAGADTMLYPHWGMKLDTTPLFYLFSSPSAAAASGGFGSGALLTILLALLFGALLCAPVRLIQLAPIATRRRRLRAAAVGIVLTAALFLPIRGGVTVSTMNLSRVYFSDDTRRFVEEWRPIREALGHRPFNPDSQEYKSFLQKTEARAREFECKWRGNQPPKAAFQGG